MTAEFADAVACSGAAASWPFHMPGHRGGAGASAAMLELFGVATIRADVTELQGVDYLHDARRELAAAQERAARVFGADRTWFLVNGATVGNLAAVASVAGDDDDLILMRASHRSAYGGVTLAGARPRYLMSGHAPDLDLWLGPTVDEARAVLVEHPAARAIHITSPSYYGICADVAAFAELAHGRGVPLLVDEAHGAHFACTAPGLPRSALACGADLVVQSPHKTLSSLTQSSLLHARGPLVDVTVVDRWLGVLQSSSPSALLLASLDLAVDAFQASGRAAWTAAIAVANGARERLGRVRGVRVHGEELLGRGGVAAVDPTKLIIDVSPSGRTGYEVADAMRASHGVFPEFADRRRIVVSIGPGDGPSTVDLLVESIAAALAGEPATGSYGADVGSPARQAAVAVLTPRQAGQRRSRPVALAEADGRVAAEYVIPYPPGVPLVVPGERLDAGLLATLAELRDAGARIVGPVDQSGGTLRCLDEAGGPGRRQRVG